MYINLETKKLQDNVADAINTSKLPIANIKLVIESIYYELNKAYASAINEEAKLVEEAAEKDKQDKKETLSKIKSITEKKEKKDEN